MHSFVHVVGEAIESYCGGLCYSPPMSEEDEIEDPTFFQNERVPTIRNPDGFHDSAAICSRIYGFMAPPKVSEFVEDVDGR
ncbi:unnamed protein product [Cylicocyclus nassatus]|uniref:Uncharacterized protein n=1 Tax=Cylicocyclus nassatus TaxID=53992 RepID=A0AA36HBI0_CYLNA|nr:unnamed protein product [Cylicocyclus nassatus]